MGVNDKQIPFIALGGPPKKRKSIMVDFLAKECHLPRINTEVTSHLKLYYRKNVVFVDTIEKIKVYLEKYPNVYLVDSLSKPYKDAFNAAQKPNLRLKLYKNIHGIAEMMQRRGGLVVSHGRIDWVTGDYNLIGGDSYQYALDIIGVLGEDPDAKDEDDRMLYVYGRCVPPLYLPFRVKNYKNLVITGDGANFLKGALTEGYPFILDFVNSFE